MNVTKFKDLMTLNNCFLVFDHLSKNLPDPFESYFHTANEHHNHATKGAQKMLLDVPMKRNLCYESNSVTSRYIFD